MPISVEVNILLSLMAMGFLLGMAFDLFYIFKSYWNIKNSWFNIIIDFTIWVILTGGAFTGLLLINWGQVRFYVFLAMALGYLGYYVTLRNRFCKMVNIFMHKVVAGIKLIKRLVRFLKRVAGKILSPLLKLFEKVKQKIRKNLLVKKKDFSKDR